METLPAGSELLLLVCAIAGLSTWYLSNFTDRADLPKLAAGVGVCSMVTLGFWVFF